MVLECALCKCHLNRGKSIVLAQNFGFWSVVDGMMSERRRLDERNDFLESQVAELQEETRSFEVLESYVIQMQNEVEALRELLRAGSQ